MRAISLYFMLSMFVCFSASYSQTQVGQAMTGIGNLDYFGGAVDLDRTGHRIVIGASQRIYPQFKGQVRVFDLVDSTWVQVGQELNGAANNENFGRAVAISADGETIIVWLAQLNTAGGGYVQVYHLVDDTVWVQLGSDLTGSNQFGRQIDINSNGSRVVIGSGGNYAEVYEWSDSLSDWTQLGSTLFGSSACSPPEYFGRAVAIDGVGNRIVVGASNHDLGCSQTSNAGRAAVFEWDGTAWTQLGQSLFGVNGYGFGGSVDISGNGNRIACGAANVFGRGHVFTYEYNIANGTWEQYGDTIQGIAGDKLGRDVNLSYDGCTIACGAEEGNGQSGRVKRYRLVSSTWTLDGTDLQGAGSSSTGAGEAETVAMNADGSIVALGTPRIQSGSCRVYEYERDVDTTLIISSCDSYLLNGIEYNISGTYTQSISAINSCDSMIQLELTILELDSSIVQNGDTLMAIQDSVSYQWYHCDTDSAILGETSQHFVPTESGNYAVSLSNGICEAKSNCMSIQIVSINGLAYHPLQIYPNPVGEIIHFGREVTGELRIWASNGRLVKADEIRQSQSVRIDNFPTGLYVLRIVSNKRIYTGKFFVK